MPFFISIFGTCIEMMAVPMRAGRRLSREISAMPDLKDANV
jgi:hypothetical protein